MCRGDFGRLGHGDARDVFIPRSIPGLSGKRVRDVACGDTHTLVSTFGAELWGFGRNQNGQLGLGHTDDEFAPICVEDLKVCIPAQSCICQSNKRHMHCRGIWAQRPF